MSARATRADASTARFGIGEGLALVSVIGYTTVNALVRSVALAVDPFSASLIRQLPLLAVATVAVLVIRPRALLGGTGIAISRRDQWLLMGSGIISFLLGNVLLLVGFAQAGLSAAIVATQGGMVLGGIALSAWFLHEPPTGRQLLGAAIVLAGLVLAVVPTLSSDANAASLTVGFLAALGAGLSFTVSSAASRSVQRDRSDAFVTALFLTNGAGTVALALYCAIRGVADGSGMLAGMGSREALVMLAVGLVNAVAIGAITLAARYTTVTTISTLSALIIVTSMVVGATVFSEVIHPLLIVGAVLIIAGVLVVQAFAPKATTTTTTTNQEANHV
jgi:drug/metabolite transporter (DMT)-like permease